MNSNKLKLWKYKGFIQDGRKVKGKIPAYNKDDAIEDLKAKSIFVSSIKDATPFNSSWGKPSKKDLSIFLKDLSSKTSAGVDIKGIFIGMKKLNYNFKITLMIEDIIKEIDSGSELHEALEKTGKFSLDTIEIIKAGEVSGNLPLVLEELSVLFNEEAKVRSTLIKSSFKPLSLIGFAFLIVIFIVPRMVEPIKGVYKEFNVKGDGLPWLTEIVMDTVNFISGPKGITIVVVYFIFHFLFKFLYKKFHFVKKHTDGMLIRLPLIGSIKKKMYTYITVLSFGVLYKTSINVSTAFHMISKSQSNYALKKDLLSVYESLKSGKDLNVSIEQSLFLSTSVKDNISNGFKDGSLKKELEFAKKYAKKDFDDYSELFVKGSVAFIGSLVSLIVGVIIIAIYLPMFGMIKDVMGQM